MWKESEKYFCIINYIYVQMEKGQMTKSFIWKKKIQTKNFQFSNTHEFNLFVMEKEKKKK